jgi:hypothetical protein
MSPEFEPLIDHLNSAIKCINLLAEKEAREKFDAKLQVLVRHRPSLATTCFHTPWMSCGRVRETANFKLMTQSDARRLGLRQCPACPWDRYEAWVRRTQEN